MNNDSLQTERPSGHRPLSSGDLTSSWALDEFFESLGPIMRLPPKAKGSALAEEELESVRPGPRPRLLVGAVLALLSLTVYQLVLVPLFSGNVPVPAEYLGSWSTDEPRYVDRGFVISSDTVQIQLGPANRASYPIVASRWAGAGHARRFVISYRDTAGPVDMALQRGADSSLNFAGLPTVVWHRE